MNDRDWNRNRLRLFLIPVLGEAIKQNTDNTNRNCRGQQNNEFHPVAARLGDAVDLCIGDGYERRLIEVTALIGFRIDEEALGATFHDGP